MLEMDGAKESENSVFPVTRRSQQLHSSLLMKKKIHFKQQIYNFKHHAFFSFLFDFNGMSKGILSLEDTESHTLYFIFTQFYRIIFKYLFHSPIRPSQELSEQIRVNHGIKGVLYTPQILRTWVTPSDAV